MFYRSNSPDFNEVLKKMWDSYPTYGFKTYSEMPTDDVEVNHTKDGAYLVFEVPGFNKTNLKVEVENGVLSISGERTSKVDSKENKRTISKKYEIGSECDTTSIEATIDDELVTLFIPNFKKKSKKTINLG